MKFHFTQSERLGRESMAYRELKIPVNLISSHRNLMRRSLTLSHTIATCTPLSHPRYFLYAYLHTHFIHKRRFLPNGMVLSLLLNDNHSPSDVVHLLKPTLEMKVRNIYIPLLIFMCNSTLAKYFQYIGPFYRDVAPGWIHCLFKEPGRPAGSRTLLCIRDDAQSAFKASWQVCFSCCFASLRVY